VRLVSLLPSATEIVYALGLGDDLVGVTFECDEPPAARSEKTIVVGGRDTGGMTPARSTATSARSWPPGRICIPRAARLVGDLRSRLARIATAVAGHRRPRVAVVEWVDPPFTAGHWIPDLVSAAGGQPVAARSGVPSVPTNWAAIAAAAAELIVVAPCGYHLPGAIEQARSAAQALPGVPVWAIDADGIVVRPGPRLVDGVEAIASILHPDAVTAPRPPAVHRVTAAS
jgi:ABC-type Fe3+-hydroxamate transport system substrate-binding protein